MEAERKGVKGREGAEREGLIGEKSNKGLEGFFTNHKSVWRIRLKRQGMALTFCSLSFNTDHKEENSDDIPQQILVKQLRV